MAFPFGFDPRNRQPRMTARPEALDTRRTGLPLPLTRPRRRALLEPLEPRILLSADAIVGGFTPAADAGFDAIYQEFADLLQSEGDALIQSYVPGFLITTGEGEDQVTASPTFGEAMSISVNISDLPGDDPFDAGLDSGRTLLDRYNYIVDTAATIAGVNDDLGDEVALRAMDINLDGRASAAEVLGVLFFGKLEALAQSPIGDYNSDTDVDTDDIADFFDDAVTQVFEPAFLSDQIFLDVFADNAFTPGSDLTFSFDVQVTLFGDEQVDLGYMADQNEINLDPVTPGDTPDPTTVGVDRVAKFENLVFGFNGATDGNVTADDFYFAMPNGVSLALQMDSDGPYSVGDEVTLDGMHVNIGFLGTTVQNVMDDGMFLDMRVTGFADDPSHPDALGFDAVPAVSGSGSLTADMAPENVTDNMDPGDYYVLDNDIVFTLQIGQGVNSPERQVTVADGPTAGFTTIGELGDHLESAIDSYFSSFGLITVDDVGGKLRLNLPDVDPGQLGFGHQVLGVGSIEAAVPSPLIDNTQTVAYSTPAFAFLLRVGSNQLPRLVSVPAIAATLVDPDTIPNNGDEYYEITKADVINALQGALDAAFDGGVVMAMDGDADENIELVSGGNELEITRTLILDTVEEITLEELANNAQVLQIEADTNSQFTVDLTLKADEGLEETGTTNDYLPEGTIHVDLDPWDQGPLSMGHAVEGVTVDSTPSVSNPQPVKKANFFLTFGGDLDPEMLDFNVIQNTDILSIINNLGTALNRLAASQLFTTFDLPFADATLSELLPFGDMVADRLLLDDGDDGTTKPGTDGVTDQSRLLQWKLVLDDYQLVPTFTNAQQLEHRLGEVALAIFEAEFGMLPDQTAKDAFIALVVDDIDASYDNVAKELTYSLGLEHNMVPQSLQPDGYQVPLDFQLDLEPLASLVTEGNLYITAESAFDFTLGIQLGDAAVPLTDDSALGGPDGLNDGDGVALNTNYALTTLGEIDPIIGRLTGNALFTLTVQTTGGTDTYQVKILRSEQMDMDHPDYGLPFTDDNLSFQDLVQDINDALVMAGVTNVEAEDSGAGTGMFDTGRIVLRATSSDVLAFQINSSSGNRAYSELGLVPESAATVSLVAPAPIEGPVPGTDVQFKIDVVYEDGSTAMDTILVRMSEPPDPESGNQSWTDNNNILNDLINDINAALEFSGFAGQIVASRAGSHLVLSAVGPNGSDQLIRGFSVTDMGDADKLGLDNMVAINALSALGVNTGGIGNALVAGVVLRGQDVPSNPFGRLTGDVVFKLNTVELTIDDAATFSNTNIVDLVRDINDVIDASSLAGMIVAENDGFHIRFRAIDPTVGQIDVAELDSAERGRLGFQNGDTGGTADRPDPVVVANRLAPVSYGVTNDISFDVHVSMTDPADDLDWTSEISSFATLANRSLYDLAADINQALNAGFIGAYGGPGITVDDNPLIAVVQGKQIVIGLKTTEGGSRLVGDATPAAMDVDGFSITADGASDVAGQLKLVKSVAGMQTTDANLADFIVYFSDGSSAAIALDDPLIPAALMVADHKLAGTVGDLIAEMEEQARDMAMMKRLEVTLLPDGSGLLLHDLTGVNTANPFRVVAVNGSPAAQQLGILGADTDQLDIGQYEAEAVGNPDGFIEGGQLAVIDLIDRVFLQDPSLTAELSLRTDGVVSAEGNFGFVGIKLQSAGDQALYDADLEVPFLTDMDNRFTLDGLLGGLAQITSLWDIVDLPVLTTSTTDFSFDLSIFPDTLTGIVDIPASANIEFQLNSLGALHKVDIDPMENPGLDTVQLDPSIDLADVVGHDLEELANFEGVEFADILGGLGAIADFLDQFGEFGFLGQQIPLLGLSINDVLEVSDRFRGAIQTVSENPAGGLQGLSQALSQAFGIPEFASMAEQTAYFNDRGIPDPSDLIGFVLQDLVDGSGEMDLLRIDLRLPVSFSQGRAIDLDLGTVDFLGESLPVDLQGGAGLNVTGYLDVDLHFGVDLDDPSNIYLFDDASGLFGAISAGASNLAFTAAIGPMGVFIKDGLANSTVSFGMDDSGSDDNHRVLIDVANIDYLLDGTTADFEPNFNADISGTFPVFFPTDSEFLGDIVLDINGLTLSSPTFTPPNPADVVTLPDFSNIDLSSLNPFGGANVAQLLETLDFFLQGLQDVLDGEVFGLQLPLVGDQLGSGADFIEQLRRDILDPLRQYIEQAPDVGLDLIQALLYSLLGPGSGDDGMGGQVTINTPLGMQDLSDFLGLPGEIPGLFLLADYLTGPDGAGAVTVDDVVASTGDDNMDMTDDNFLWKFRLGRTYSPSVDIDFDLGFDALGLTMNTGLDVKVKWDLAMGLGLSTMDGAYIYVGDQRGTGDSDTDNNLKDDELIVTLDVDIPDSNETDIEGRLAFLQLLVDESHADADVLEMEGRGTFLHAEFDLDLFDGESAMDDRIGFSELGGIDAEINLEAEAEVNLDLRVQFNDKILPETISSLLPALNARFLLDWETGDITSDQFDFADSLEFIGFRDIELDMGSFIGEFLGPFINKIAEVTEPLQPVIDALTTPIPVLSDLAGGPVTLIDIAGMFGEVNPDMIYAIADIITLVNKIGSISGDMELLVPLGDLTVFDPTIEGMAGFGDFADNLMLPNFKFADNRDDLEGFLGDTGQMISDGFDTLLAGATGNMEVKALSETLVDKTAPGAGNFIFPLFEDPFLALGLLFGADIPLLEYDLPPFGMDFTMSLSFPIWGPLYARITGGLGITIDLAFGYDTRGVREFAAGDFNNPLDLLAGLYVLDTDQSGGAGSDVPEMILRGEIFAGAELNLGFASAGAEGGVIFTTNFDLYDNDSNGKVYIDELVGNFLYEWNYGSKINAPAAISDITINIAAQLRAFIEILTFSKTFPITPPITIVEFSIPFDREPFLATERGDGAVLLNVGSSAGARLNGDVRDIGEEIHVKSLSENEIVVWSGAFNVGESAGQKYHIGANDDGERIIIVDAGDGDDMIDLSGVGHGIKVMINGGAGDDIIVGGQSGNQIHGGLGDDDITGGDGHDLIFGEGGNDTIDGVEGIDWIFGDYGRISLVDGNVRFRSLASDDDGDDFIHGGNENSPGDVIFGGGGLDTIFGDDGDDLIFGDGGYFDGDAMGLPPMKNGYVDFSKVTARGLGAADRIQGNAGNDAILGGYGDDYIDGGADSDLISGGLGFDTIYGGSADDLLFGDYHDDIIFGYRDPVPLPADVFMADAGDLDPDGNDYVEGGQGNDYIRGQAADDTLHGNRGFDIIFGGAGNDIIGAGLLTAPWIDAADQISDNEAGGDIIFGGAHNDTIDAGEGSDVVFGDDGLVVYLDFVDTTGLLNYMDTGSRIRTDQTMSHKLIGDGDETVLIDGYGMADDDNNVTPDLYVTESDANDGSDHIIGGDGRDIIFGGGSDGDPDAMPVFRDTIFGDFDPAAPPTGPRPTGLDTIIGDGGRVELFGRLFATAQAVSNVTYDGVDHISGNDYGDYIFGGGDEDLIWGFEDPGVGSNSPLMLEEGGVIPDNDIILGDNGVIVFDPTESANRIKWIHTTAVALDSGRSDEIYGQFEKDVILGGLNSSQDILVGGLDDDIILGDQGELVFDGQGGEPVPFGDPDLDTLDRIRSYEDGLGGGDKISGQQAQDILIGGTGGDEMYGDADGVAQPLSGAEDVEDIMLGDNADIYLVAPDGAMGGDLKLALNTAIDYIVTTDTMDPLNTGGADTMSGNAGSDIIAGGVYGDTIYGDRLDENMTHLLDGHDIILGDNALLEWLSDGRFSDISGIDIGAENPLLFAKYGTATKDTDLTTLDLITTAQKNSGGRDYIRGDDGNDFIFGGTDADEIYGDDSDLEADTTGGNDLMFGDHGRVYPQFSALRGEGQNWWDAFNSRNFFAIDTGDADGGEGDRTWGEEGNDSMLGQQGDDRMWGGGDDDDMTGGHNVSGGYDVLTLPAVETSLFAPIADPTIDAINDLMDGGAGDDAMAGDNAIMWRRGDDLSPRFRALTADAIYDTDFDSITANINSFGTRYLGESDPADAVGRDITLLDHDDDVEATPLGRYGNDAMAGGADSDLMFGQLGNDLMQGDGNIDQMAETDLAFIRYRADTTDTGAPSTAGTLYFNIPEDALDADDYMEGNGGSDLMFGGLGQDDIIGGSSSLFGLDDEFKRPDSSDFIFGGVGIAIARNDIGATHTEMLASEDTDNLITTALNGHSRDADFIMGDNANVYRLVQGGASGTDPGDPLDEFLDFNYDDGYGIQVIPRAMQQLDYTLGGADYNEGVYVNGAAQLNGQPADNGDADLIHGESGDDVIFGMTGSDVLFGEGQDDDIVGGYGHDWISGGTGQDGILGDDGLILTSRNSADYGEPLYGIGALDGNDRPKYADGDVVDEVIKTPGEIQYAVINLSGQLKKTADLVPFSYDPDWIAFDDEFPDNQDDSPFADDIIFGGLGTDWLHAGSGDDAVSGAEALPNAWVPDFDAMGIPTGVLNLGYSQALMPANLHNMNPGDVLAFNPVDLDGQHTNNRLRAGEFFLYDEYDPRRTILLDPDGELYKGDPSVDVEGVDYFRFLLNFDETEGLVRSAGQVPKATGQQATAYPAVNDDGKDAIFGDLGNDWLVGGTGRDNIYGGWGNDLLNADDNLGTNNDLNDMPDTHPYYEDRAYGGAGRDILIGNTGGDRLIDWVGEYNSYLVPYAPFGQASVSRTLQPFLPEFLYALSAGDGADPTRPDDTGADPLRNGEPDAEMGLVLQKDFAWQAQTGAPADPQAGNIPGGHRDVLRSAGFNDETSQGFAADIGTWSLKGGKLYVEPTVLGESAVSVWNHDQYLPSYFELTATITPVKPIAGYKANAYIVFDYQGSDDFKFAGLNGSTNKIEIGYHDAGGWHVTATSNLLVKPGKDYNILLAVNGTNTTIVVNNRDVLTWTFAPRVDVYGLLHNINEGMVGLGADNGRAAIDNVRLQVIPPAITLTATDDFSGDPTLVAAQTGNWSTGGGKLSTSGTAGAPSLATGDLTIGANYLLNLGTKLSTSGTAGLVFDYYAADDFKWVAWSKSTGEVQLGHYTERDGWVVDKSIALNLNGNVELGLKLKGSTVSVVANNQVALSHAFNAIVTDGQFGLLASNGNASFDSFTVSTDDPSFAAAVTGSEALKAATAGDGSAAILSEAAADAMGAAAMARWSSILGATPALFSDLEFVVGDLDGLDLARLEGTRITVDRDAAGHGWFVDRTPDDDVEFRVRGDGGAGATPASPASGRVDLLTAMMHELGHALGFDHDAPVQGAGDVMASELVTGFRAGEVAMPLFTPVDSRGPAQRGPLAVLDNAEMMEARPGRTMAWDADTGALLGEGVAHNGRLFHYVQVNGTPVEAGGAWLTRDVSAGWLAAETGGRDLGLANLSEELFEYGSAATSTRGVIEWTDPL